ncbi:hypothetical protein [uncultured Algibacter sp.]|uniref:hypothetical protein n=1 Tax=uncultured Algibacter sp. TaxID=298659 RepID=UPI003217BAA4
MKTKMIFNVNKFIGIVMLVFIFSCSSDDNKPSDEATCTSLPSNNIALYTGELSAGSLNDDDGTVTIEFAGNNDAGCPTYSATFSEAALNNNTESVFDNIVFRKDGDKFIATQESIGGQTFVIDTSNNDLQIQVGSISFNGTLGESTGGDGGDDTGSVNTLNLDIDKVILYGLDVELTDKETYDIPVDLGTSGTSFDESEIEFVGTGTIIEIEFYSNTPMLAAGTYTFGNNEEAFTFDGDISSIPENDDKNYSVEAGTITVSYSGDDIIITYDLSLDSDTDTSTDIDAKTNGNFTGELLQIGECFVTLPNSLLETFDGDYSDGSTGSITISLNADETYNITYSNGADATEDITFCKENITVEEFIFESGSTNILLAIDSDGEILIDAATSGGIFSN